MSIHARKQAFGKVARRYQKFRLSYPPDMYNKLFALLNGRKQLDILDLGCGTGKSTEPLFAASRASRFRLHVIGCDPDAAMLREARASAKKNKLPITHVEGTAEKLPFSENSFDAVVSGTAFHWFATRKTLRKIYRTLKPGGVFFVFWIEGRSLKPGSKRMIANSVLEKYNWSGIPKRATDHSKNRALFEGAGFSRFGTAAFPFETKRTIDQIVGMYTTHSIYALMAPQQKKDFKREMKAAYVRALGKNGSIISKRKVRINYAIKK